MAAELVNSATSEKLAEMDWMKNIQICEIVAHDNRQAREAIKAIKKRLGSKSANSQLYAVMLLEVLMNNIGEQIHKQVIDVGILPILVKIVKKKSDLPVRERIFLLLDATQTSLGGASGKFPQYYTAYYDLVSAGIQFPQRHPVAPVNGKIPESAPNNVPNRDEAVAPLVEPHVVPESSIIQKATNALDVLKEVLDAVDVQNPEGAKDEFTLDLVEQCSFQKQKVMHLVMTSRNEKMVSQAIDLNERLQKVLTRHDAFLSCKPTSTVNHLIEEHADEEEEAEQLVRRLRKGKASLRPEDEEQSMDRPHLSMLGSSKPGERLNRPLIRPLCLERLPESNGHPPSVAIPPPPAKHTEREKYFQENKVDGSGLAGHVRGLSLHSRSGSMDFSD